MVSCVFPRGASEQRQVTINVITVHQPGWGSQTYEYMRLGVIFVFGGDSPQSHLTSPLLIGGLLGYPACGPSFVQGLRAASPGGSCLLLFLLSSSCCPGPTRLDPVAPLQSHKTCTHTLTIPVCSSLFIFSTCRITLFFMSSALLLTNVPFYLS